MKKLFAILSVVGVLTLSAVNVQAQDSINEAQPVEQVATTSSVVTSSETDVAGEPMHQVLKQKFLEGGALWMAPILLCLVLGLSIVIERIIYLNLATINTKKFLGQIEEAINRGDINGAKEIARNTRGPVASIFYQGLERYDEGIDVVEKSVVSYGSVQMGQMESGLSWISLFIAIAPMLGFMGTVVGLILSFDAIEVAGDISPSLVAGGMKVALLTTVAGLIAAVTLQIFYNYLISKVDSLVIDMEDSSISLVDMLTKCNSKK